MSRIIHEPLLDVADLARLLGTTPKAVYGLRHRGGLPPAIRVGRLVRWRHTDVELWLTEQTEQKKNDD